MLKCIPTKAPASLMCMRRGRAVSAPSQPSDLPRCVCTWHLSLLTHFPTLETEKWTKSLLGKAKFPLNTEIQSQAQKEGT